MLPGWQLAFVVPIRFAFCYSLIIRLQYKEIKSKQYIQLKGTQLFQV